MSPVEKGVKIGKAGKDDTVYEYEDKLNDYNISGYTVVNTSGAIVKNGVKKDGDGFKVVLKGEKIQQIYVED